MDDDILDVLVAHGVPSTVILRVAKMIANTEVIEGQRAAARERMRAVRERSRTLPNVQNSSEHDQGSFSKEGKISPKEESKKVRKKENKQSLSENWQPIGPQRDPAEAEEFRDHARAKGWKYSDWNAAYRNYQRSPYNARNKPGAPLPSLDAAERAAMLEEFHRAQLRRNGNGH